MAAIVSFSLQLTPLACKSSLNVDRQVFLGRPLFLLPSAGVHSIAAGWAFWCHPYDMTRTPESPFPYHGLQSRGLGNGVICSLLPLQ